MIVSNILLYKILEMTELGHNMLIKLVENPGLFEYNRSVLTSE